LANDEDTFQQFRNEISKGEKSRRKGRDRGGNTAGSYSRRTAKAKAAPLKGILKAEV